MSLEDFATPLSVGASYLSKLERGASTNPSPMLLDVICRNFYTNRVWLLEGQGKPFLVEEYNAIAASKEFIPSPVPDQIWVPFTDNYIDQIKELAIVFRNYADQMGERADALEKQARDFEAIQVLINRTKAQNLELTKASAADLLNAPMKPQWPILKTKLQEMMEHPGARAALVKYLKVDPTQISQWLSEAQSAREPGGEYTLQMLKWVELQERSAK